eukprot:COSAG06_NODE_18070_length_905_cov_1.143921_1_plen_116_part_00
MHARSQQSTHRQKALFVRLSIWAAAYTLCFVVNVLIAVVRLQQWYAGRRRLDKQQLLYEQFLHSSTMAQEFQLDVEQFHDFSKRLADLNYDITLEIKHKVRAALQCCRRLSLDCA